MIKHKGSFLSSRWKIFRANRRAYFSLWIFCILLFLSTFANFIANDKPILIYKNQKFYFPVIFQYSEREFGGFFETEAQYSDGYFKKDLLQDSFVVWPLIKYSYDSIIWDLQEPAPISPSLKHLLGTDDQARDVLARLIYAYRVSLWFGILLCISSVTVGVFIGAIQGFYGGRIDLFTQRLVEIWSGIPLLFLMMILSSFVTPSFWWILMIVLLFSWMGIVGVVRAEFLRGRNMDYIKIAKTLGVSDLSIIFKHLLPNAMVATITYIPFIITGSIATLISLDFLGFGMPVGSASLGELLQQGKNNLYAPHLAIISFFAVAILLSILVFIGEGVRDAFNPKKNKR
ncbi:MULTISPECIES: ABC transporter permease [unclassified Helicobacter]|uniref:ABC transporter permease n=1 Tax=unclassified Helicobacter TaxID=2593540 RepID=UPI000CF0FFD6|nr:MULTISPECIES: ABC transporter permease [unclassified Helicobacter]